MASLNHPNIVRYFDSWFDDWTPESSQTDTNQPPVGKSCDSVSIHTPPSSASASSSSSSFAVVTSEHREPTSSSASSANNISFRSTPVDDVVYLYIRMELCRTGTLKDWLDRSREHREVKRCLEMYRSVAQAVDYLHQKNFMHRDIKVTKVLYTCFELWTRAKQAQACNTATCLRISDIFTYLFRYLLIHSITY